jgi:hypothetical protein
MKSFFYILIGFILISCGTYHQPYQDKPSIKTRYYNKQGRYTGYSIETKSGKIRYYDNHGKYKGYSK